MRENKKEFKSLLKILLDEHGLSVPQLVELSGGLLTENIIKNATGGRPYRADTVRINCLKAIIKRLENEGADSDIDDMPIEEVRRQLAKAKADIAKLEKQVSDKLKGVPEKKRTPANISFAG